MRYSQASERKLNPETLIYALAPGETRDYMESLISWRCKSESDVQKVITAATADGWTHFRIAKFNGEKPDFAASLKLSPTVKPSTKEHSK